MQMRIAVDIGQRALHDSAHAELVDGTHVEHGDALLVQQRAFAAVDAADPDLTDLRRRQRCAAARRRQQLRWSEPAQTGHRHAVQIAARRELRGVEVGMRIEPEHDEPP